MSKIRLLGSTLFLLLLASCIPSLHGIVTSDTIITDDRLLGAWNLPVYNYWTVEEQNHDDTIEWNFKKREKRFSGEEETSTWIFERAASITVENLEEKTYFTMSEGAPSLVPDGMTITSKEDLPYYFLTHQEVSHGDSITTRMIVRLTSIGSHYYMDFYPKELEAKEMRGIFANNYLYGHSFARFSLQGEQLSIQPFEGDYIKSLIANKRIRLNHEKIQDGEVVLTASTEELRKFIEKYGEDEHLYQEQEILSKKES